MTALESLKTVIEDFQLLKDGEWQPNDESIECSIDNLNTVKQFIKNIFKNIDMDTLIQQKKDLVNIVNSGDTLSKRESNSILGVIYLLETIQGELTPGE